MTKKFIGHLLHTHFNLKIDMNEEEVIIDDVSKGAEIKGANLWVLIFAIIIASIGLNVNSTAVIIGAMLISPLMGPLIAIGLGLSINDFDLIKRAIKNLGFALTVSLIASILYFLITPLDKAQTEILARTSPTIFDVFIAFAGGLAGMVATTRKVKTNVIPGVAIATALMPPLCTAGYGIASGNMNYFFGAFYLFIINCVFIFLGSFLIARSMRFRKKVFVDKVLGDKIKRYIYVMITLTVLPSGYLAYNMVQKSIIERRINVFLEDEVSSRGLVIIEKNIFKKDGITSIDLSAVGQGLNDELVKTLNKKLTKYKLEDSKISFKTLDNRKAETDAIKTVIIEELYRNNEEMIKNKDDKIALLEKELAKNQHNAIPTSLVKEELQVHLPELHELIISKVITTENNQAILLAYLKITGRITKQDTDKTREWLRIRTQSSEVKLYVESTKKIMQAGTK